VLQIAPSGDWRHAAHQRNPQLRCVRAQRDDTLAPHIERVWQDNMRVYGADKVWKKTNLNLAVTPWLASHRVV
jgi:putative transposase